MCALLDTPANGGPLKGTDRIEVPETAGGGMRSRAPQVTSSFLAPPDCLLSPRSSPTFPEKPGLHLDIEMLMGKRERES